MSHLNKTTYGTGVKDITMLAWPVMLSMASHTIVDFTDTLMVGWIGTNELAAIGVATTVLFLLMSFFIGLFEGVKVLTAQSLGACKAELAWSYGISGLYLVLPCAALVITTGFLSPMIFAIFGGPKEVQDLAIIYFNIRVFAPVFWFIMLALTHFFQGLGDTKTPMRINILVCVVNLILDPIFIFGFGPISAMGVSGSAIATVLANVVGSIYFLHVFLKKKPAIQFPPLDRIRNIVTIGWPSGVRWFFDIASFTMFTAMVARLGQIELAANQICVRIVCLSILPNWGIAEATCILTGHHFGAKQISAIKQSFFSGLKASLGLMSIIGVFFIAARPVIIGLFAPQAEVIALCSSVMLVVVFFQGFEALQNTCSLALYGTGDTKFPMYATLLSSWCIMLPLAYLLGIKYKYGLFGMWLAATIHFVILSVAIFSRFMSGNFKSRIINNVDALTTNSSSLSAIGTKEPVS